MDGKTVRVTDADYEKLTQRAQRKGWNTPLWVVFQEILDLAEYHETHCERGAKPRSKVKPGPDSSILEMALASH